MIGCQILLCFGLCSELFYALCLCDQCRPDTAAAALNKEALFGLQDIVAIKCAKIKRLLLSGYFRVEDISVIRKADTDMITLTVLRSKQWKPLTNSVHSR